MVLNVGQYLLRRYESVNIALKKVWYFFFNSTTHWTANLQYEIDNPLRGKEALDLIKKHLTSHNNVQVYRDFDNNKAIHVDGVVYSLSCDDRALAIGIGDQRVGYRDARRILESEILILIESIERNSLLKHAQYSLQVKFGKTRNPYLVPMLKTKASIDSFQCKINYDERDYKNSVSISLDSVLIVAQSKEMFRKLSLNYIVLSGF